jgi:biopolymer transport protein ExbD
MPLKTQFEEMPVLNLTSMIDVLLVLIIFFMMGSTFSELERQLSVKVPRVNDSGPLTPAPTRRIVNVDRNGRITLDRSEVTLAQLETKLSSARQQYEGLGVVVRGDADVNFQQVANVLNSCKQAGISELGISVRLAGNSADTKVR